MKQFHGTAPSAAIPDVSASPLQTVQVCHHRQNRLQQHFRVHPAALRKQIKQDTGLTPEEERIVAERLEKIENREEGDYLTLDEARKELDIGE